MMVDTITPPAQLTPSMDIFAAGCSLMELFAEGQPPFDFAQLLSYRAQEVETTAFVDKLEDSAIRVGSLFIISPVYFTMGTTATCYLAVSILKFHVSFRNFCCT